MAVVREFASSWLVTGNGLIGSTDLWTDPVGVGREFSDWPFSSSMALAFPPGCVPVRL